MLLSAPYLVGFRRAQLEELLRPLRLAHKIERLAVVSHDDPIRIVGTNWILGPVSTAEQTKSDLWDSRILREKRREPSWSRKCVENLPKVTFQFVSPSTDDGVCKTWILTRLPQPLRRACAPFSFVSSGHCTPRDYDVARRRLDGEALRKD